MNDGLMEVVAIDNLDLAILHAGGSGASVCRCKKAVIRTKKPVPMQVDGEPCLMKPCIIEISMDQGIAKVAKMLARNKSASCKTLLLHKDISGFYDETFFSDAVKDDEIENWAAKKIQSSFKEYRYQKSMAQSPSMSAQQAPPKKSSLRDEAAL